MNDRRPAATNLEVFHELLIATVAAGVTETTAIAAYVGELLVKRPEVWARCLGRNAKLYRRTKTGLNRLEARGVLTHTVSSMRSTWRLL